MTRHEMRQSAFILIFERIFNPESVDEIIALAKESENIEIDDSVIALFKGVEANKEQIDAEIAKHLKKWTINRISKVSLAVLRLAMYEILFSTDLDIDVIISEAVKIAQTFTFKDDVSFVNGVLSSVAKERQ
jgi:N utilization substance protein B